MVNARARIEIAHSKRFGQKIVKTWSSIGWEWFGPNHPALPEILNSLRNTGEAEYSGSDADGTFHFKALDDMDIVEPGETSGDK